LTPSGLRSRNAQLNATLAEITELLNANSIPSVILKGQGVAQNYRKPEQRMSGDIDLYVGEANYKKAIDILQHSGNQAVLQNPAGTMQKSNETVKHYHMQYGDVQVELHKFANYLYNPIENRYFQRLTKNICKILAISRFYQALAINQFCKIQPALCKNPNPAPAI
jgi:hypothetical protein